MQENTGKLPHRPFRHIPMHVVYRLKGSLPVNVIERLRQERSRLYANRGNDKAGSEIAQEEFEVLLDNALHTESNGPYHLSDPAIATAVLDSWHFIAERLGLFIYAICVMSNHVHVIARSASGEDIDAGLIMGRHKSFTGKLCNRIMGQPSGPFWEVSYFDRDIRAGTFDTVMWYVLNNPVKCNLVAHWEDWPWTYLNPEFDALYRRSKQ
ncbi:REP element-mobilizing transposase RayT [Lewinella aquimaris]|uniref:REP element-mobilizing transposase RayT n=1 Tax=Neolewinella aquimaris TaxID=1835722 RepID=A0A840EFY6_9BACT|nr:transposase [Neolewinella aquimaris]MBB4080828.1 REP element-mobilizing transposase RayT [Neolewinella aquimaris]